MTIPATVPVRAWRNATWGEEWQFTDDAGDPVSLVGYSARAQVRLYGAQAGDAVIDLLPVTSAVQGVWISDPLNGRVQIRADQDSLQSAYEALMGDTEPGASIMLTWDLLMTLPGGDREVWAQGAFEINPGVTVV